MFVTESIRSRWSRRPQRILEGGFVGRDEVENVVEKAIDPGDEEEDVETRSGISGGPFLARLVAWIKSP